MTDNKKERWVMCPHCSHKAFKIKETKFSVADEKINIEIKCSSCKNIYEVVISKRGN